MIPHEGNHTFQNIAPISDLYTMKSWAAGMREFSSVARKAMLSIDEIAENMRIPAEPVTPPRD
ncbi:MAG: hypothetical protein CMF04_11395 [Hyphomonas sp.]|nr:hypothetical protein [Hyphomonas sp.]